MSSVAGVPDMRAGRLVWDYDEVDWTSQRCYRCLFANVVELLVDGEPLCIGCADELVERVAAISIYPAMRETLPPLWER